MAQPNLKHVLIAVHFQNDVLHPNSKFRVGVADDDRRSALIGAALRLFAGARKYRVPIMHVRIAFQPDHANLIANCALFNKVKAAAAFLDGTWGADYYSGFAPLADEFSVVHTRNNAFFQTELESLLEQLRADRLVFAGIATNYSVEHSVRHAVDLGYAVSIASDACTTADATLHDASLRTLALLADIKSSDAVIAEFAAGAAAV